MNSLQRVQKVCKVFKILSQVAMILCFVSAAISLAFGLYLVFNEATTLGGEISGYVMTDSAVSTRQSGGVLIAECVNTLFNGILLLLSYNYFKYEQIDGTPFTLQGAERLRKLGISTIVLPIISGIIYTVIISMFDVTNVADVGGDIPITLGIALIVFSVVLKYGAELENKVKDNENDGGQDETK